MSFFVYISVPRKIEGINCFQVDKWLDLCFKNPFAFQYSHVNLDGFDTEETYRAIVNIDKNVDFRKTYSLYAGYKEHPKPYLLEFEKRNDRMVHDRKFLRKEFYEFIEPIMNNVNEGEFIEIFCEVETKYCDHRTYDDRLGPPMIEKTIYFSELLNENSVENLTQHMMKVTLLK